VLPDEDGTEVMRDTTDGTRAGTATSDESGAAQQVSTRSKKVDPATAASRFATPQVLCVGLHANCAQSATPLTIRLVRTIPKSAQQLCGLDKRLARAEIVAMRVVQVLFVCCGPGAWI
jgi:hypothetical protein